MLPMLATTLSFRPDTSLGVVVETVSGGGYYGNIVVVLIFVLAMLLYGFMFDPHNMLVNLMSIYVGFLLAVFSPVGNWSVFNGMQLWAVEIFLFVATVVVVNILLSATHLFRVYYIKNIFMRWTKAGVTGGLHAGLFLSILFSMLPTSFLSQLSPGFRSIFIGNMAGFFWIIIPIFALGLIRNPRKGRVSY